MYLNIGTDIKMLISRPTQHQMCIMNVISATYDTFRYFWVRAMSNEVSAQVIHSSHTKLGQELSAITNLCSRENH